LNKRQFRAILSPSALKVQREFATLGAAALSQAGDSMGFLKCGGPKARLTLAPGLGDHIADFVGQLP
jgi:hypothetical protein